MSNYHGEIVLKAITEIEKLEAKNQRLRYALIDLISVAEDGDSWETFPEEAIEKALEALKEESDD